MIIALKPVTIENWYECTKLRVKPEQLNVFPAPVVFGLQNQNMLLILNYVLFIRKKI
ncbi:hypothetical protein ACQKCU_24675 [Heyndrickxia sporothermodurans]